MAKPILKISFLLVLVISLSFQYSTTLEPKNQYQSNHSNKAIQSLNALPLYFVENKGQEDECVKYHARILNANVYFTSEEIVYQFILREDKRESKERKLKRKDMENNEEVKVENIRMRFVGANERVEIRGRNKSEAKFSYFRGNDPRKWVSGARTYHKVIYKDLYPQIDLIIYGTKGKIKNEYRVRAGGEVEEIEVRYEGINRLMVNRKGQLEIKTQGGVLIEDVPFSYQIINGHTVEVETEYVLDKENTIRFKVDKCRKDKELIIDPALFYSTYLGGSSSDSGSGIVADGSGNVYVTGGTSSTDFPTSPGAYSTSFNGGTDAFITKLNSAGTSLLYSTYLGGGSYDDSRGIAVDGSGNAYVTGETSSADFPTTSGAFDTSHNGSNDAFITKLNSSGTSLLYSTYLGGSSSDGSNGIAVDGSRNAYVAGTTSSSDYPTTSGAYDTIFNGSPDVFVAKFNSTGNSLLYSSYLGGSDNDYGEGIAVDGSGNAYVAGTTFSNNFPCLSGYDSTYNGYGDAFITQLNSAGTSLLYSTYLGGSNDYDQGYGIAVDGSGNAYVTGYTWSADFPTTVNSFQPGKSWYEDAFITKLSSAGNSLVYSTFLGGTEDDKGYGIALDSDRNAYVTGWTTSPDFPTTPGAFDTIFDPDAVSWRDAFVTKFNSTGNSLLYSTYLGGSDRDYGKGIAVNGSGNTYVTGSTESSDFPTTSGAFDTIHNGSNDAFITKMLIPYPLPIFDGHDFTGNGTSDVSVWRPTNGVWYIKGQPGQGWGAAGDIPVNGDYNGDNVTDIAVWRPATGRWYIKGVGGFGWGTSGDIPVPGHYGGGATNIAVFRPSTGKWYIRGIGGFGWGALGDVPVPGDYNGDGVTDLAIWRPSTGRWYIKGVGGFGWGADGDIPVPGDYNGDGVTDIAVWRPSNGRWYIRGIGGFGWGASGDIPVPGDYNGDGVTDIAVWRPSNGRWYIKGQTGAGWGTLGDIPLVR